MTRLAILHPTTLLGKELRQGLALRRKLWQELRLLTTDPEEVGTLTEIGAEAALVQGLESDSLHGIDLLFLCGEEDAVPLLDRLDADARAIVLSPAAAPAEAPPVVAGANIEQADGRRIVSSPHPAVVALAHLLHPLRGFEPEEVVAWLLQPATMHDQAGLEELLDQTRSILSFDGKKHYKVFGSQLAFNVLPTPTPVDALAQQLGAVLELAAPIALQVVQGAVFHSFAASLFVRCRRGPPLEEVRQALRESRSLRLVKDPERLGPIRAAAREDVLVGSVTRAAGAAGGFWIWGVMDNLTRGGASNALEIAERLLT